MEKIDRKGTYILSEFFINDNYNIKIIMERLNFKYGSYKSRHYINTAATINDK